MLECKLKYNTIFKNWESNYIVRRICEHKPARRCKKEKGSGDSRARNALSPRSPRVPRSQIPRLPLFSTLATQASKVRIAQDSIRPSLVTTGVMVFGASYVKTLRQALSKVTTVVNLLTGF